MTINNKPHAKAGCVQGGFQWLNATDNLRKLYRHHARTYWKAMDPYRNASETAFIPVSDQLHLDSIIRTFKPLNWAFLDQGEFAAGTWYKGRRPDKVRSYKAPAVVLNNWITGNGAKERRAKEWRQWFLSDDGGACVDPR